ncbi:MAG: hypothetical protein ACF8R7_12850, partial [Phycisphaerales bacterium JB039]
MPQDAGKSGAVPRKRRRRLRRVLIAIGLLAALLGAATLTPLAGLYLRPIIGPRLLGVKLQGGSLRFTLGGDLLITGADFRIEPPPGSQLRGEATRFLRVEQMRIALAPSALLGPGELVQSVTVSDAEVLVAKPVDGYEINLLEIARGGATRPSGPLRAPGVQVERATLTLAEYDASGAITPLRTMRVTAGVRREEAGRYSIWVRELDEGPSAGVARPIQFDGVIDGAVPGQGMFSGALGGVDLADWPPEAIPLELREDYRRFAPSGALRSASFVYDEAAGAFRLSLDLAGARPGERPVRFVMPLGSREDGQPDLIVPVEATGRMRAIWRDDGVSWARAGASPPVGDAAHDWNLSAQLTGSLLAAPCAVDIEYWFGDPREPAYYAVEANSARPVPLDPERWAGRAPEAILDEVRRFDIDGAGDVWLLAGRDADTPEFVETGLHVRDATATYRHFRYPVEQISGDIVFRNRDVSIGLAGRTPAGAPARVDGTVRVGDAVTMDVKLSVRGAAYDQVMIDALNDRSEHITELLFNDEGLDDWRQRGLVDESFAIGGAADLDIHLTLDTAQSTEVGVVMDIRVDEVGVRNRYFPMPAIGRNVHVRGVKELRQTLPDGTRLPERFIIGPVAGEYTTPVGGALDPSGTRIIIPTDDPDDLEADVRIAVSDIPIGDLLIASIPGSDPRPTDDPDRPRLNGRTIARRLDPWGVVGGVAHIHRPPGQDTAVRVGVTVDGGVRPPPLPGAAPLEIDELTGTVNITRSDVHVDLRGRPKGSGWITANIAVPIGDAEATVIRGEALALSLAEPIENLVAVFRPAEARRLLEFKELARPSGLVDAALTAGVDIARQPMRIVITNIVRPAIDLFGGRLTAPALDGSLLLDQAAPGAIAIEGVRGDFAFDGTPLGLLQIDGARAIERDQIRTMRIGFTGAHIESDFLGLQAQRVGGERFGALWRDAQPAGRASGWLDLVTSVTDEGPLARVSALRIEPTALAWTRNSARAQLDEVWGVILAEADADGLAGDVALNTGPAGRWEASAEGQWRLDREGALSAVVALAGRLDPPPPAQRPAEPESAEAPGPSAEPPAPALSEALLPASLRAALPLVVLETIESIGLQAEDAVTLSEATLRFGAAAHSDGAPVFEGRLRAPRVTLGPDGLIDCAQAEAWLTALPAPEGAPAGPMEMLVSFDHGVIWGLPVTGGRAVFTAGDTPGLVVAPMISANSAGGRLTASAQARRAGDQWRYTARLISSGLPVTAISRAVRTVIREQPPTDPSEPVDPTEGVLDLALGVEGVLGDRASRRGAGSLRISAGSPVDLPPALRLLVSTANARFATAPYDHVEANFFLEGDLVAFPAISMSSRDIIILGYGLLSLADGAVQLVATSAPRSGGAS